MEFARVIRIMHCEQVGSESKQDSSSDVDGDIRASLAKDVTIQALARIAGPVRGTQRKWHTGQPHFYLTGTQALVWTKASNDIERVR